MSMSSNISDLPDADYEESEYTPHKHAKKRAQHVRFKENFETIDGSTSYSIVEILKNEINENNLLLLALFYIAGTSQYSSIISKFVYNNVSTSSIVANVIKAALLVVTFVITKKYF